MLLAKKCVNKAILHIFCPFWPINVREPGYLHLFSAAGAAGRSSREQKRPYSFTKQNWPPGKHLEQVRAETEAGEKAEEESGDHQQGKHRVKRFARALPDAAEVQDVQREVTTNR